MKAVLLNEGELDKPQLGSAWRLCLRGALLTSVCLLQQHALQLEGAQEAGSPPPVTS